MEIMQPAIHPDDVVKKVAVAISHAVMPVPKPILKEGKKEIKKKLAIKKKK